MCLQVCRNNFIGSHKSPDDILHDVCDGTIFQDNPVLQNHEQALQIIGYFDEFTLINPLSGLKKHKIGTLIFFTTITNLNIFKSQVLFTLCLETWTQHCIPD